MWQPGRRHGVDPEPGFSVRTLEFRGLIREPPVLVNASVAPLAPPLQRIACVGSNTWAGPDGATLKMR
jgi:hypothetical protein